MKKFPGLFLAIGFAALLAAPEALFSYDSSPYNSVVIPECIWAPATGGGTWVTQLQITDMSVGSVVTAWFYYNDSAQFRHVATLWASPGAYRNVTFPNVLQTMQSLDPTFTYSGRVGALWLTTQDGGHRILAQARTVNGNYGKTFPGLPRLDGNTSNVGRDMVIMNLTQNATYRSFIGVLNGSAGTISVEFSIWSETGAAVGINFVRTLPSGGYLTFNPFAAAGAGSGTYDDCVLRIQPYAGIPTAGATGLFCYGSSANNYTNDSSAHLALQAQ